MTTGRRSFLSGAASLALGGAVVSEVGCGRGARGVPLWFSYGGKNREVLLKLVADWNRDHPDALIDPVFQGDYFELLAKLRTAIAARRAPAITHVVAEVIPYLVKADALTPLDGLPNLDKDFGLVPELALPGTFEGGASRPSYGLPFNRSTPIAYFNGAVMKELGLAPPTTWDELVRFATRATAEIDGTKRYGFACPIDWWFWVALVHQAGGRLTDDEGRFTLGGDAGVQALQLWQRMVHELGVMRPPSGRDYTAWQNINQEFLAGRAAMVWNSSAFLRYLEENAKFEVIAAPLPKQESLGVPSGGTMFVIPKAARPEWVPTATRFLAYMMQPGPSNEFATSTGYIPVTRAGIEALERDGYYQRRPNDRAPIAQLPAVRPWPWQPALFRIQRDVVQGRLEAAVLAREDARAVLETARRDAAEDP